MYKFIDNKGTFQITDAELTNYLYFPIANESGMKSAITPDLSGDSKLDQNSFLLEPVSAYDLHNNKSSRNFWCKIEGRVFSLTGVSLDAQKTVFDAEKDDTIITAGIMWHQVERYIKKENIKSKILSFVPANEDKQKEDTVEIMMVTVTNEGNTDCTIEPTAAIPMYSRSADNIRDHRHVTSLLNRVVTTKYGVENKPTLTFDERGHKVNELTYYVYGCDECGSKPISFYPTVDMFVGEGGSFLNPKSVIVSQAGVKAGVNIDGLEAMGAFRFENVTLKPNESKTYIIVMGIANTSNSDNKTPSEIFDIYNSKEKVEKVFEKTKEYWDKQINITYETGDKKFDNFMHWVSFQPMLRRIYGCSFLPHHDYGKGGRGWRDLWQDCLALLLMNPDGVSKMLVNNYKGVRLDGTNATIIGTKPGEFVADRNNIVRVWCDHGVWPLITTKLYVDQTGDYNILFEETEYFKDKQIFRAEKKDETWNNADSTIQLDAQNNVYKGSILEHILLQNITSFYDTGKHGFLRLRGADWNDALDMAEENGESVAFTAAYINNFRILIDILKVLRDKKQMHAVELAKEISVLLDTDNFTNIDIDKYVENNKKVLNDYYTSITPNVSGKKTTICINSLIEILNIMADILKIRIQNTQWVDGYYNGYYDNSCNMVEGIKNDNVRMMLTSQVFTIMSRTASDKQVGEIVNSCDKNLYRKNQGGYRLNTDFKEVKTDLGRMFGFAYGHKENGAVFSHMTIMYANALYQRGFVKEGYKALNTLYNQALDFDTSKIYPGIPEYFDKEGRGLYHYLTGAASWYMMTVVNEMFGVKGLCGDLLLEPKLLNEQFDEKMRASISLNFADKDIKVTYINTGYKEYGDRKISKVLCNGKEYTKDIDTKVIISRAYLENITGKILEIEVYMD